jgi:calcium-dependent protein kinase
LYTVEEEIGKGSFGRVTKVVHRATAQEFACKSISKSLPGVSDPQKQAEHLESIKREVFVLKQLRSCLNVAKLEEVFETDTHVHIVQELCKGGELEHSIGRTHYSERTVRFQSFLLPSHGPSRVCPPPVWHACR